jgi:hypothetical protein
MDIRERQAAVVELWRHRPLDKRTENDVLIFYGQLREYRPDLLPKGGADDYQLLMAELRCRSEIR